MYISSNSDQLTIEDFFMPFGGNLLKTNRWVRLASMMPWEHIDQVYMESVDLKQGRPATPSRVAFGAIFIKENDNLTDEGTVAAIAENPYMQYFLGLTAFQAEPLFDSSMMTHYRKRFPVEFVAKVNEYICTGVWPEQQRNVDRNDTQDEDSQDNYQNLPDANVQEKSAQSGKKDKNTSKKKLKKEKKQKRQMYQDACDRNAVEGRNGNAKRRFGLDLIAAKLDETAKTPAFFTPMEFELLPVITHPYLHKTSFIL